MPLELSPTAHTAGFGILSLVPYNSSSDGSSLQGRPAPAALLPFRQLDILLWLPYLCFLAVLLELGVEFQRDGYDYLQRSISPIRHLAGEIM